MKSHNRHPRHDLLQTCEVSKYLFPIWIHPTENLLTYARTSFRIDKFLLSKCNKHKSKINKRRIKRITWNIVWINKINQLIQKSLDTPPSPLPRPYTNLWRNQTCMSHLDTAYRQFATHMRTSFRINERWSDINAYKQINNQWCKY